MLRAMCLNLELVLSLPAFQQTLFVDMRLFDPKHSAKSSLKSLTTESRLVCVHCFEAMNLRVLKSFKNSH